MGKIQQIVISYRIWLEVERIEYDHRYEACCECRSKLPEESKMTDN